MDLTKQEKKLLDRFCAKFDQVFNCKEDYGCDVSCPLNMFIKTMKMSGESGIAVERAIEKLVRQRLSKAEKAKILTSIGAKE